MTIRVALFGSLYRGKSMLESLIRTQEFYPEIEICGIATDDPSQLWSSPSKRIWKNPHTLHEENMVCELAEKHNIPCFTGNVKSGEFQKTFVDTWNPDVSYMGVFGQRIPERIWSHPLFGFFNFHTCSGHAWPSNVGGDPLRKIFSEGRRTAALAMHQIDNQWDQGELIAFSDFFYASPKENPVAINKRSSYLASDMMLWHIEQLTGISTSASKPRHVSQEKKPMVLPFDGKDMEVLQKYARA